MPRKARRITHARDPQVEAQLDELVRAQNEHVESPTDVHGVGLFRVAKTSREDQWPDWGDVQGKPEAFPPVPHAATHAAGASDPVTPASIGAETPQGAQEKADLAEAHAKAYTDAHAADATLHVTAAYRAAMDNAKAPPSATNPFVTEETLNDAMTGSAKPGVETLADLAAIPPEQRADKDTRLVEEDGRIYRFDAEATEGDVKPNVGSGYWIAVAAATQNHNNLAGLQGGRAEERYHLTRSEHDMVLAHPSQNTGVHGVGTAYVAKTSRADQWPDWGDIRNKPSTFTPSAHASTHAAGGADPITPASIGAETPAGAQAKADAVQTALDAHRGASTLDHPDGSVTDAKIGSRTIDQAQAPSGSSGTLTQLLSWLANRIKAITGATNWYDNPATTLAAAKQHIDATLSSSTHGVLSGPESSRPAPGQAGRLYLATGLAQRIWRDTGSAWELVAGVPRGVIQMWSGSTGSIPTGWVLCDGRTTTAADGTQVTVPDLRDRFIVGAGGAYAVGDKGGAAQVTLTVNEIPAHSHGSGSLTTATSGDHRHYLSLTTSTNGAHTHSVKKTCWANFGCASSSYYGLQTTGEVRTGEILSAGDHSHTVSGYTDSAGAHTHSITGSTASVGGGQPHENRPPYYALCFIMKL